MLVNQEAIYVQNGYSRDKNVEIDVCGKTRGDKIKNGGFRGHLRVASIGDKIRKTNLRWFGHIQHMPGATPVRKVWL